VPGQHHQTAEQTTYKQVDDRNDHSRMIPAGTCDQARSSNRAPHGPHPAIQPAGREASGKLTELGDRPASPAIRWITAARGS
jgi:hypothetical protein